MRRIQRAEIDATGYDFGIEISKSSILPIKLRIIMVSMLITLFINVYPAAQDQRPIEKRLSNKL